MPNSDGIADPRASTSRTARYQSTSGDPRSVGNISMMRLPGGLRPLT